MRIATIPTKTPKNASPRSLASLAKLKPNPDWAKLPLFDRTGWKRMAFGDFAESIGERAEPRDA